MFGYTWLKKTGVIKRKYKYAMYRFRVPPDFQKIL